MRKSIENAISFLQNIGPKMTGRTVLSENICRVYRTYCIKNFGIAII
jgi:hypothetical protein